MSLYQRYVLPHLINATCGIAPIHEQRSKVVPRAEGRVLEVGMGSGLNLLHYDKARVEMIWGLEPSEGMRRKARRAVNDTGLHVEWLDTRGEEIPLGDNSVDSIVLTYTLCSITDWRRAMQQMRRVLKPAGVLLFSEHGESPDEAVRKWQTRITPVWKQLAGGCHLDRPVPRCLEEGGFNIKELESGYLPGPKVLAFNYSGIAV